MNIGHVLNKEMLYMWLGWICSRAIVLNAIYCIVTLLCYQVSAACLYLARQNLCKNVSELYISPQLIT